MGLQLIKLGLFGVSADGTETPQTDQVCGTNKLLTNVKMLELVNSKPYFNNRNKKIGS